MPVAVALQRLGAGMSLCGCKAGCTRGLPRLRPMLRRPVHGGVLEVHAAPCRGCMCMCACCWMALVSSTLRVCATESEPERGLFARQPGQYTAWGSTYML